MNHLIGLIGHRSDAQLSRLAQMLKERGATPVGIDLTDIPAHVNFHWDGDQLRFGDLELEKLCAVYARTAHFPMPTFIPGETRERSEELTFDVRECGSLMNTLISELERRVPMVNPATTHRFHSQKPFMYSVLQQAGVPVPEYVVGSDLAAAAHFVSRLDQNVVIKPLMGGEVFLADLAYLKAHHAEIERRPFLLQRRIIGRSLRAYVVGGEVVAAGEIVHGDGVDWRADLQRVQAVRLSDHAAHHVRIAAQCQDLLFAAVDIEEEGGEGGTPWVIDVNPGPMFAGFETHSGLNIAGPLADYLLELARNPTSDRKVES